MTTDEIESFILESFKRDNPSPKWNTSKPDKDGVEGNDYIVVKGKDNKLKLCHYACDTSGDEQPPFKGWFYWTGSYYAEIRDIPEWCYCPRYNKE